MPVQWINRPGPDFRGFSGRVCAGAVRPGDRVRVLPSGDETRIAEIVTLEGTRPKAEAGDSITLTLSDDGLKIVADGNISHLVSSSRRAMVVPARRTVFRCAVNCIPSPRGSRGRGRGDAAAPSHGPLALAMVLEQE